VVTESGRTVSATTHHGDTASDSEQVQPAHETAKGRRSTSVPARSTRYAQRGCA